MMIPLEQRTSILMLCDEAIASGARQHKACDIIGISPKTIQRWKKPTELHSDGRQTREFIPFNKISPAVRQKILSVVNTTEFCTMTPNQIVPILAERGVYIASERTFYRVLNEEKQLQHRQKSNPGTQRYKPEAHCATEPGQCLSWDITYLKTTVLGQFFYLYLFLDIFSRKIVGWQIHERESSQLAAELVQAIALQEGYDKHQVVIHSDNGSAMKGATLLATFQNLGIMPSFSRPSVSNDNPFSESLFKTVKYCPYFPANPFQDVQEARQWMIEFVQWYNHQHRHSGIQFVTPAQRHAGLDKMILAKRHETYQKAKQQNPERWSGNTRNWNWQNQVMLNPDKSTKITNVESIVLAA